MDYFVRRRDVAKGEELFPFAGSRDSVWVLRVSRSAHVSQLLVRLPQPRVRGERRGRKNAKTEEARTRWQDAQSRARPVRAWTRKTLRCLNEA
jgi:hypothetical protein